MKLIKPSFEIIEPTGYTLDDIYKSIELAGKVSHKSEHTIKENSAKEFVDRMIKLGHGATLEFGTVYLAIPCEFNGNQYSESWKESKYNSNQYSRVRREYVESRRNYVDFITTNLRVLVENGWLDDLKYLCKPTKFHLKRYTVRFILSRSISHEFVRHRVFSFIQESQRYCLYTANKFDNEITFIKPCWLRDNICKPYENEIAIIKDIDNLGEVELEFLVGLSRSETCYKRLIKQGWKAEEAREVLPNATKTELYMCGFVSDWEHLFKLRTSFIAKTGKPHPDMSNLCDPLYKEFVNRGLMESLI